MTQLSRTDPGPAAAAGLTGNLPRPLLPPDCLWEAPIIVLDGTAGAGKSSIGRGLAMHYQLPYINCGASYRVLALHALRTGVSLQDQDGLAALLSDFTIDSRLWVAPDGSVQEQLTFNGEDVTDLIRSDAVSMAAAEVAAHDKVHEVLYARHRERGRFGCVIDGRMIGKNVFPDSPLKFYIDASLEVRGSRHGNAAAVGVRDDMDHERLQIPPGAQLVDTSYADTASSVALLIHLIDEGIRAHAAGR